jgi:hypothetical protein
MSALIITFPGRTVSQPDKTNAEPAGEEPLHGPVSVQLDASVRMMSLTVALAAVGLVIVYDRRTKTLLIKEHRP